MQQTLFKLFADNPNIVGVVLRRLLEDLKDLFKPEHEPKEQKKIVPRLKRKAIVEQSDSKNLFNPPDHESKKQKTISSHPEKKEIVQYSNSFGHFFPTYTSTSMISNISSPDKDSKMEKSQHKTETPHIITSETSLPIDDDNEMEESQDENEMRKKRLLWGIQHVDITDHSEDENEMLGEEMRGAITNADITDPSDDEDENASLTLVSSFS